MTSITRFFPQASRDRETSCSRLQSQVILMPDARIPESHAGRDKSAPVLPEKMEGVQNGRSRPEDTVEGCVALAASALARASAMDTRNGRLRLEHSAAKWQERAALLQSLETSSRDRQAIDKAQWQQADADELLYQSDQDSDQTGSNRSEWPTAIPWEGGRT